ncbi:putative membrane protein YkoI [Alkalihalobacillus xiaoxiensis]|uniref:Membrane protein YkoI n=1 Tax=Shouchella xiaoxiensis TaxID=766895 RepID=A0ABS2T020_9BACI|nr:PepSY domain-containing protein [Shouchella xiaoxiensis]MBM7840830.1 putative membrane protein YkoI [Shouchella xiaoxiensis]
MNKRIGMITGAAAILIGGTTWTVANAEEKNSTSNNDSIVHVAESTNVSSPSLEQAVKQAEDYVSGKMIKAKQDEDDGVALYEIDVRTDKETYEFEIAVDSGDIIEIDGDLLLAETQANPALSKEEVEKIAKETTGLTEIEKTELELKNGKLVYETEFFLDDDVDIKIDAETGDIVEMDDDLVKASGKSTPEQANLLSFDELIALLEEQFGANIRVLDSELDHDDGLAVYELDLIIDDVEYEIDLNAENGDILKQERD